MYCLILDDSRSRKVKSRNEIVEIAKIAIFACCSWASAQYQVPVPLKRTSFVDQS